MSNWQPSSNADAAIERAAMLSRMRDYFDKQSVVAVDTPALHRSAASDIHIESLKVESALCATPLYLHTSPESCMKRLLAAGYPDIYSICRVFRDGEAGKKHQPEFTMLEWYRRSFDLQQIIDDTLQVIAAALHDPQVSTSAITLDYRQAFIEMAGVDPMTASIAELADAAAADAALRESLGDKRDNWLDLLLAGKVCTAFSQHRLTVLRHYPISQAALSRRCPSDPAVADRFEVFLGDIELANGYVELTDATEQQARMMAEQEERKQRGQAVRPTDDQLLAALAAGMPDCAGVALGIERLQMVLQKTDDIRDVISFTFDAGN